MNNDADREEQIFEAALQFPTPEQRVAYVKGLVTLHDGIPVPKVIDFGIAKATQGRLTDQTLFTAFEQFIGQGHFTNAVEWLQPVSVQSGDIYRTVQAYMTLAMAQHQLKQTDRARATLTQGIEITEKRFPKAGKTGLDDQWYDWIIAHVLIREAKALIDGNSDPAGEAK